MVRWWCGFDSSYLFQEDAQHFHTTLKTVCDRHEVADYQNLSNGVMNIFTSLTAMKAVELGIFFDDLRLYDKQTL